MIGAQRSLEDGDGLGQDVFGLGQFQFPREQVCVTTEVDGEMEMRGAEPFAVDLEGRSETTLGFVSLEGPSTSGRVAG